MQQFDFAIIGAGVSGWNLTKELATQFADKSILLLERDFSEIAKRTISFWSIHSHEYKSICSSWNNITISAQDSTIKKPLAPYTYYSMSGLDYKNYCSNHAQKTKKIECEVMRVMDREIQTDKGSFYAGYIFDSRPLPVNNHDLRQCFHGLLLETKKPAFDPRVITMFDFRIPQHDELRFVYTLPFNRKRALIELFGNSFYEAESDLKAYITKTLKISSFKIISSEGGSNSLTLRIPQRHFGNLLKIGNAGGMLKPSSGYAFKRIEADSKNIINSLKKFNHPFNLPRQQKLYSLLDHNLLKAIRKERSGGYKLFTHMFLNNAVPSIFKLLDEEATIPEIIKLAAKMPKAKMLRAMLPF